MILECANGVLCPIAAMHVWRDELEGGIPLEHDCFFIGGAGFIIQGLEISNEKPMGRQKSHDSVVCCNALADTLGIESLLEDEVAVSMEGNHDILVAGACSDGEAASVVGEELAEQFCDDKDLVGRHCNRRRQNC